MHDQASANGAAMQTIKVVFPLVVDVDCYSHTLDLVGEKFDLPVLDDFVRLWINLFCNCANGVENQNRKVKEDL